MIIFNFMNQEMHKALHGEKTNIKFPYLSKIRRVGKTDKTQ